MILNLQSTLFPFLDQLFQPVLAQGPYVSMLFFSACLAGLFSIIYWILLDIEKADEIKEKMNTHQEKMKKAQKENDSETAREHMSKSMKLNQKFMMLNFKPMIGTMIFVAFMFPWLGQTYAPSIVMQPSNNVSDTTLYTGQLEYANKNTRVILQNNTLEIDNKTAEVGQTIQALGVKWDVKSIESVNSQKKVRLDANFATLPVSIPLAGSTVNWLMFYILVTMPLTYSFRKALGIQ
ncbi:MAG: EMC3/TMCO1 family protein [Candidatus Nanohaloarchaea archaeon]